MPTTSHVGGLYVSVIGLYHNPIEFLVLFDSNFCLCVERSLHMIDPELYSVAQWEHFSPAGAKNICRVSNFIDLFFPSNQEKKKKADITKLVGVFNK